MTAWLDRIKIETSEGFFSDKEFNWSGIEEFTIITGPNGSGKTKLLEYIDNDIKINNDHVVRYIDVNYWPPSENYSNLIENKYNYYYQNKDGSHQVIRKSDNRPLNQLNIKELIKANNITKSLDYEIIDRIMKERKEFNNDIPKVQAELERLNNYIENNYDIGWLLPRERQQDKPWDRIDRILMDFGLSIRIDRINLNGELGFLRFIPGLKKVCSNPSETALRMTDLSSGEKMAFALALWTWGNADGQKTDILIVDEFDAHLNPSISQIFNKLIKDYFVEFEEVQVIMTTHSPSTVAYAKEANANIVWMEDGRIDPDATYADIIRELSNGYIAPDDFLEKTQLTLSHRDKCVVFTEGETDQIHIQSAIKALGFVEKFANYFIFGCTGANTIQVFASRPTGQSNKIIVLDNDDEGHRVNEKLRQNSYFKEELEKDRLVIVFISEDEKVKVIEDLFDQKIRNEFEEKSVRLKCFRKKRFAKFMSEEKNLTVENFTGFKGLLEIILNSAGFDSVTP